jgi:hypothetical protein
MALPKAVRKALRKTQLKTEKKLAIRRAELDLFEMEGTRARRPEKFSKDVKSLHREIKTLEKAWGLLGTLRLVANPEAMRRLKRMRKKVEKHCLELEKDATNHINEALWIQEQALWELKERYGIGVKVKSGTLNPHTYLLKIPKEASPLTLARARSYLLQQHKAVEESAAAAYIAIEALIAKAHGDRAEGPIERRLAVVALKRVTNAVERRHDMEMLRRLAELTKKEERRIRKMRSNKRKKNR